jgi:hypothetical protein
MTPSAASRCWTSSLAGFSRPQERHRRVIVVVPPVALDSAAVVVANAPGWPDEGHYKWIALSNTTLGTPLATLDASITLIAMPDIFRGIGLDPLVPSNSLYLLG